MKKSESIYFDLDHVDAVVESELLPRAKGGTIFAFHGPLGAGKTTMIKDFLKRLGIGEVVTSPTFTYVKSYKTPSGSIIHHFDLYRIENITTFYELGFDEYLTQPGSISVIEWPEVIDSLLQSDALKENVYSVYLNYCENDLQKRIFMLCSQD